MLTRIALQMSQNIVGLKIQKKLRGGTNFVG
jgi:hypothetical protein